MTRFFPFLVLLAILAAPGFVFGFNLVVDPYAVFHGLPELARFEPNLRIAKTDYYARNCGKYDGFIFGSSRSEVLDPDWLEAQDGYRVYNLSAPLGTVTELNLLFERFQHCPIRIVYYGVDFDLIRLGTYVDPLRRLPDKDGWWNREGLRTLKYYLTDETITLASWSAFTSGEPNAFLYDRKKGTTKYLWQRRQKFIGCRTPTASRFTSLASYHLRSLIRTMQRQGIQVGLIFNPVWNDKRLRKHYVIMREKEKLIEAADVVYDMDNDFSVPQQWHDCSHFSTDILPRFRRILVHGPLYNRAQ